MRVIDTSAWIEWFDDSPIAERIEAYLVPRENCIVPTVVQLELAKWLYRELSPDAADMALAYIGDCKLVVLDSSIALVAAEYCRSLKLATADAIIYATAREAGADLVTCDVHFRDLDGVIYIQK